LLTKHRDFSPRVSKKERLQSLSERHAAEILIFQLPGRKATASVNFFSTVLAPSEGVSLSRRLQRPILNLQLLVAIYLPEDNQKDEDDYQRNLPPIKIVAYGCQGKKS